MEHKKAFYLASLWTAGIAVACLISMSEVPKVSVFGKDKSVHSFFYLVFSILWFVFLTKKHPTWTFARKASIVILSAFLYGSFIEMCQEAFTATRTADINDVFANMSGSLLGVIILFIADKFRKKRLS